MITLPTTITALLIPFASYHFHANNEYDYNQFNPGIVVEMDWLTFGGYRNSFDKTTVFVQGVWFPTKLQTPLGELKLGASLGLGTGYEHPVIGGFQAQFRYINLTYIPRLAKDGANAVAVSVRIPI